MRHGPIEVSPVGVRWAIVRVNVGPVDRKAGHDLADGTMENVPREVGRLGILPRYATGVASQRIQLAGHLVGHDAELAVEHDVRERTALSSEVAVQLVEAG